MSWTTDLEAVQDAPMPAIALYCPVEGCTYGFIRVTEMGSMEMRIEAEDLAAEHPAHPRSDG